MPEEFVRALVHHQDGSWEESAIDEARRRAGGGDRIEFCRPYGLPQWERVVRVHDPAALNVQFILEPAGTPGSQL